MTASLDMSTMETDEGPSVWLILPTYNEASNLEPIVAAVH